MAFCSNCGTQLADDAKFCASCGTRAATGGDAGGASPAPAPKPATEKVGNIRKCPACGAEVPAMTAVCPSCGHEFSNVQVNSTVQAFFERVDAVDQEEYEKTSAKSVSVLGSMVNAYRTSGGAKRKKELIEGFPIPNSKEDILEFIILAASRYVDSSYGARLKSTLNGGAVIMTMDGAALNAAWKVKCEQAYNKAKLSFGSDKDAIARIESILKEKKIIK